MTESGVQPKGENEQGDPRPELAARLRDLCTEGKRRSAIRLARSILRTAAVRHLDVGSSTITVETDHFVGTHEYHTDDGIVIERSGSYRCTIEGVDLSFTTATMNQAAYREAISRIEAATGDQSRSAVKEPADTEIVEDEPAGLLERLRRWLG